MTTIGTILAKNPDIGLEKTGSEIGSMDSAFAIFTAILANMSAQNEETSDQDAGTPELSAEDLFDQIIADDKVSPLIGPADRKDLLQILDNILENPDRISSVIDLNDAYTIFAEMPAAKTSSTRENTDGAPLPLDEEDPIAGIAETPTTSPSSATEKIFAAAAISMPASSPRGSYGQNRNPVQALASIIRKITPPKVQLEGKTDLSTPSSGKHGLVDPNAYGPFPKNSAATAEV
ncbi:MAG: hypothetical protein EBZ18_02120, partial [Alphaproteobacteria bacterium]|nr:hypothetical protein [Alphaproteobacteria bacterium]